MKSTAKKKRKQKKSSALRVSLVVDRETAERIRKLMAFDWRGEFLLRSTANQIAKLSIARGIAALEQEADAFAREKSANLATLRRIIRETGRPMKIPDSWPI